jgi:nucleotide-binding universal stress UspA family protein
MGHIAAELDQGSAMTEAAVIMLVGTGVFLLIGVTTAIAMGRRGHDPWMWGVLGALFGPFVIALLFVRRRGDERPSEKVLRPGTTATGDALISVLVGVDGSSESLAAVSAVVGLLADRIHSLTIATVLDVDAVDAMSAQPDGRSVFERDARTVLDEAAAHVGDVEPTTVILSGRPADALLGYAQSHGVDLIAIGKRGTGLSVAVLGSVAEHLVRQSGVLVLVAGRAVAPARPSTSVN